MYGVTEARVVAYANLSGDHTPIHTDEEYAKTTPFGMRVAHGLFGLSIADGLKTKSGRGQHIDIALYDCMISMHDFAAQSYLMSGEIPVQTGHDLPQSTVYGCFAAQDGYVVIAAQADDSWKRFAKLIGGDASVRPEVSKGFDTSARTESRGHSNHTP